MIYMCQVCGKVCQVRGCKEVCRYVKGDVLIRRWHHSVTVARRRHGGTVAR